MKTGTDEIKAECNKCGWVFDASEILIECALITETGVDFKIGCPICKQFDVSPLKTP